MRHRERISIRWKLFIYMLGFCSLLLLVIWAIQSTYLSKINKDIKIYELHKTEAEMVDIFEKSENIRNSIIKWSQIYDISIVVTDSNGYVRYMAEADTYGSVSRLSKNSYQEIFQETLVNGNGKEVDLSDKEFEYKGMMVSYSQIINPADDDVVIADIVRDKAGAERLILLESAVLPLDTSINVVKVELIYISVVMCVLSLGLAVLVSRKLSVPLINISRTATEVANGNYDVHFYDNELKEIAELSDALNEARYKLEEVDSIQKEIIANVSHDLRTPLTMITGYAEVMRDIPGENSPENIQAIIDEAQRLNDLVNDLLDISKMRAGVVSIEKKKYNITKSVRLVVERISKMVEAEGYTLELNYKKDVYVEADERRMYQVLYNFIGNAINYTGDDKKIFINQIVKKNKVRFEIEDTGNGISDSDIKNVWDRYYKKDKSRKRNVIGTGLGLSIAKNILEMHDCGYGVRNKKGSGTVFWFEMSVVDKKRQ